LLKKNWQKRGVILSGQEQNPLRIKDGGLAEDRVSGSFGKPAKSRREKASTGKQKELSSVT